MKGIVFSEFLELVEEKFGFDMADDIIDEANLPSGGAYTSVGTYDHNELITLVGLLSKKTGIETEALIQVFGEHLLGYFHDSYPVFFDEVDNCFDFLDTIEHRVHVEVRKLYPEAELPTFSANFPAPKTMLLTYTSKRPFSALAFGLIKGSAKYYGEDIEVTMEDQTTGAETKVVFELTKR